MGTYALDMVLKVARNCSQSLVHTCIPYWSVLCARMDFLCKCGLCRCGKIMLSSVRQEWPLVSPRADVRCTWVSMKIWEIDHPLSFPSLPQTWCAILACWEIIVSHMRLICTNCMCLLLYTFCGPFVPATHSLFNVQHTPLSIVGIKKWRRGDHRDHCVKSG